MIGCGADGMSATIRRESAGLPSRWLWTVVEVCLVLVKDGKRGRLDLVARSGMNGIEPWTVRVTNRILIVSQGLVTFLASPMKWSSMGCNNLLTQLSDVIANPSDSANLGSFGEAVAAVLLHDVLDHAIVSDDATRDKPQGIDLVTLNLAEEKIMVVEVKATGSLKSVGPRMGKTVSTRQMSDDWVAGRTAAASLENVSLEDIADSTVGKMVVHVNVARDTVSCHNVDANGKVEQAASMTIGLTDLARFADALSGS